MDPSILQSVMPHQAAEERAGAGAAADANAGTDADGIGNTPKHHMLTRWPAACMLAGSMYEPCLPCFIVLLFCLAMSIINRAQGLSAVWTCLGGFRSLLANLYSSSPRNRNRHF